VAIVNIRTPNSLNLPTEPNFIKFVDQLHFKNAEFDVVLRLMLDTGAYCTILPEWLCKSAKFVEHNSKKFKLKFGDTVVEANAYQPMQYFSVVI